MSRAFVKEDDVVASDIPERPASPYPNQITPAGLQTLREKLRQLEIQYRELLNKAALVDDDAKRTLERDIRYVEDRLARAIVVDPTAQPRDRVGFGAIVETMDSENVRRRFQVVGEDEADAAAGKLSWVSPLAKAVAEAKVGDVVLWRRPAGDIELEIVAISYP